MDAIIVEELTKYYGNLLAVNKISFRVKWREIFGFLGPNGAGKTTTIRMLCGLAKISNGSAYIAGCNLAKDLKCVKKSIGVVQDVSNLYYELTAMDNLLFSGEMYGLNRKERKERAIELLKFFGLFDKKDVKFKHLSKGQKRRLVIAAALMHKPKILFLDEPTIGLDVRGRRMIWNLIKELNKKGLTIFLTTHNIYEAFSLCNRIAIINKGKIVTIGTPEVLKEKFSGSEVLEVAFTRELDKKDLTGLSGIVKVIGTGRSFKIIVNDPIIALEEIAKKARLRGVSLSYINLRGADAEEIFLRIISDKNVG